MISEPRLQPLAVDPKKALALWPASWASWFTEAWQILIAVTQSGTTALRPTKGLWTGRPYFDTTLGIPIWWDGAQWVDATGAPV